MCTVGHVRVKSNSSAVRAQTYSELLQMLLYPTIEIDSCYRFMPLGQRLPINSGLREALAAFDQDANRLSQWESHLLRLTSAPSTYIIPVPVLGVYGQPLSLYSM